MRRSKIFGIGLSRTGTTSLTEALQILGFSAVHYPTSIQEIQTHDAAADLSVADTFEMLDARFPGSKFIYTVRERTRWIESCRRHWARKQENIDSIHREFRRRIYGTIDFNPDLFAQAYERHEHRVLRYFAERPHDLLVLDICGGHANWEMLCSFLSVPVPTTPFPNTNRLDSFDEIMIRLLHITQSAEQVAKIAKVSSQYVEELRVSEAFRTHDIERPLSSGGNQKKVDRTLAHACRHFGGINTAAAKLELPQAFLEDAIARHRRRKRTKLFKQWQLKFYQLVTRSALG